MKTDIIQLGEPIQHEGIVVAPLFPRTQPRAEHRLDLDALRHAFPLEPGQAGMIVAFGNRVCLDYVSQPSAFEHLHGKLLDAALLDAIDHATPKPPSAGTLEGFLAGLETAPRKRGPSAGLGEDVRVASDTLIGSGLELDGELLQLSAFSRA
jgi:hypothetical protein